MNLIEILLPVFYLAHSDLVGHFGGSSGGYIKPNDDILGHDASVVLNLNIIKWKVN
ncbi:9793_t:CDS:2, partial [Funneliformis caledonium]